MATLHENMALKAKDVHKTFSGPAQVSILRGVNIEVARGETVAIMGRSGEGKSTLLHILGTLETPSQGSLQIAGHLVSSANKSMIRNRHIGFIFQSFHLLEDFSVLENVLMPARIARKSISSNSEQREKARLLLNQVGLENRHHFLTKLLSGGEKQRVSIARALCNDPDLILADEPTGNLDRVTAQGIHELLIQSTRDQKKTMIVVTHNEELALLCDRRYILRDGLLYDS